jgi:hypothetical protein
MTSSLYSPFIYCCYDNKWKNCSTPISLKTVIQKEYYPPKCNLNKFLCVQLTYLGFILVIMRCLTHQNYNFAGPSASLLNIPPQRYYIKYMWVWNFWMLRCCNFKPCYSSYITWIFAMTVQSQFLPVYMAQIVCASCHSLSSVWLHLQLVSDREFLGRIYENRDKVATQVGGGKVRGELIRNVYQSAMFLHAGVAFSLIILHIYPCSNTKYINTNGVWYHGHTKRYW